MLMATGAFNTIKMVRVIFAGLFRQYISKIRKSFRIFFSRPSLRYHILYVLLCPNAKKCSHSFDIGNMELEALRSLILSR